MTGSNRTAEKTRRKDKKESKNPAATHKTKEKKMRERRTVKIKIARQKLTANKE